MKVVLFIILACFIQESYAQVELDSSGREFFQENLNKRLIFFATECNSLVNDQIEFQLLDSIVKKNDKIEIHLPHSYAVAAFFNLIMASKPIEDKGQYYLKRPKNENSILLDMEDLRVILTENEVNFWIQFFERYRGKAEITFHSHGRVFDSSLWTNLILMDGYLAINPDLKNEILLMEGGKELISEMKKRKLSKNFYSIASNFCSKNKSDKSQEDLYLDFYNILLNIVIDINPESYIGDYLRTHEELMTKKLNENIKEGSANIVFLCAGHIASTTNCDSSADFCKTSEKTLYDILNNDDNIRVFFGFDCTYDNENLKKINLDIICKKNKCGLDYWFEGFHE